MDPTHPLYNPRFPRANGYDPDWVLANEMGPNALWLIEALTDQMALAPEMRVLDMGCGRGMTSVFLAREHGLRVWANDLWIAPDDNWATFREQGVADRVCPIKAEARSLPYAAGFFDAIVSVDSYHYYGTDDLYLRYFSRFVRPGGQIGVVIPGLVQPLDGPAPEWLTRPQKNGATFWQPAECFSFHTADWWRRHFEKTELVDVERCGLIPDGWRLWLQWEQQRDATSFSGFPSDAESIAADAGRTLGFVLLVARRRE